MKTADAVQYFNNCKADLANALGITVAAICQWGQFVPPLRAYQIERLTGGALQVEEEPAA